jgi:hypothetical protein
MWGVLCWSELEANSPTGVFFSLSRKRWVLNRYESEKMWKKLWHRLHSQPVFRRFSFPRYTTSLATTPRVRPTLALYVLRAARGTHVSVHRELRARHLTSQARRRQPRSARQDASIDLFAAVHSRAQGPLSAPNWTAYHARIFLCVPLATLLSSDGQ